MYFQLTPFGTWGLEIEDPQNYVDMSFVSQLEMYFLGSSITYGNEHPPVVKLHYAEDGEKPISVRCRGGGEAKKRKRRSIGFISTKMSNTN